MALAVLGATAEEFVLKDGTKIVGKMVRIKGDSIEIKTLYGKIKVSRGDIVTINFPENQPEPVSGQVSQMTPRVVEHSLRGTSYINRTGNFRHIPGITDQVACKSAGRRSHQRGICT